MEREKKIFAARSVRHPLDPPFPYSKSTTENGSGVADPYFAFCALNFIEVLGL